MAHPACAAARWEGLWSRCGPWASRSRPARTGGRRCRLGPRAPQQQLRPLDYTLPVASAQVKTCLLLAALAADGPSTLAEPALSRDHTERMLRSMGVRVEAIPAPAGQPGPAAVRLTPPTGALAPLDLTIPGDFSAAAFLIVAAVITPGSQVTLRGVGLNPTRTGLLDTLLEMGASIRVTGRSERQGEPVGDLVIAYSRLQGVTVGGERVVQMIDEFPAFAAAAAYAIRPHPGAGGRRAALQRIRPHFGPVPGAARPGGGGPGNTGRVYPARSRARCRGERASIPMATTAWRWRWR